MATEVGTAYISLIPSAKGFGSKLSGELGPEAQKAGLSAGQQAGTGLSQGVTSSARGIATSVGGIFAAIGAAHFLSGTLDEAREAIKVGNLTNAVIKSTGGEAGVTAGHVSDLANKLSLIAGVDDEVIQGGENVLLTFTNVRNAVGKGNDIFDQATKAAVDLSAALGQDMQSSVIQLGKALNDPIKGVTALQRVGVSFTASQKEQIKTLVESGDVLGAQKIILGELQKEFGGAAAAAADPLAKLQVAMANVKESIGLALLPLLNSLAPIFANDIAPAIATVAQAFAGLPKPVQTVLVAVAGIGVAAIPIARVAGAVGTLGKAFTGIVGIITKLGPLLAANPWVLLIAATIGAIVLIITHWEDFKRGLEIIWNGIKDTAATVWNTIKDFFAQWWPLVLGIMTGGIGLVVALLIQNWDSVKSTAETVWNTIRDFFVQWWPLILGIFTGGIGLVVGLVIQNWTQIKNFTVQAFNDVVSFISSVPGKILGALASLGGALIGLFTGAVNGVLNAVTGGFNAVVGFVASIPGRILGFFANVGSWLFDAGRQLIQGFLNGIVSLFQHIAQVVGNFVKSIVSTVKGFLGIGSPSKVFFGIGVDTGKGMLGGLQASFRDVNDFLGAAVPGTTRFTATKQVTVAHAPIAALPAGAGAGITVQGPLIALTGTIDLRRDQDVVTVGRQLARETERGLRARGLQVVPR